MKLAKLIKHSASWLAVLIAPSAAGFGRPDNPEDVPLPIAVVLLLVEIAAAALFVLLVISYFN